jgi:hypothetical protein
VTLRARWVTLRARWVTLRARWVTLRARWVTLRAPLGDVYAQRGVLVLAAVGLLLLLLQPPLPHAAQSLWDPSHAPEEVMDDVEIYGARPTARSAWPAWLLLATCLVRFHPVSISSVPTQTVSNLSPLPA